MWKNNREKNTNCHKIDTLISQQTRIKGNLYFSGGLHIDGIVEGNVIAEDANNANLTIGEKGHIEGEIQVPDVIINGTVIGDVYTTQTVELSSRATISGNVYYNLIKMVIGAKVNGNLIHRGESQKVLTEEERKSVLLETTQVSVAVDVDSIETI